MSEKRIFWFHAFYLANWAFELYCFDDENDAKITSCATKQTFEVTPPQDSPPRAQRAYAVNAPWRR